MEFKTEQVDDVVIINANGNIDISESMHLEETVSKILDEKRSVHILMDFSSVITASSTCLRVLFTSNRKLEEIGRKLKLCNVNPSLMQIFELTNIQRMVGMYETREEALKAFSK